MPRSPSSGDSGALIIGFGGALGILLAFTFLLCVCLCVCFRRYESDQIQRRRFVKRNIPSKIYKSDKSESRNQTSNREVQETAPPLDDPENGDVCSICLVPFQNREKISWSTNEHCTHTFHKSCIVKWLYQHDECPYCRDIFLPEKQEDVIADEENVSNELDQGSGNDTRTNDAMVSPSTASVSDKEEDEEENIA